MISGHDASVSTSVRVARTFGMMAFPHRVVIGKDGKIAGFDLESARGLFE